MTHADKNIKRLIKHIAKEDVVPFLGSGFSIKAGAPSVSQLKEAIVNDGGEDFANEVGNLNKITLAELSEKHVAYNGGSRNPLLTLLKKMFELSSNDLSDHEYLRKIPQFKALYTTNYETFIEDAYPADEILVVNSNASYTFVGSKQITLYKIHGDLSTLCTPDSVVITTSDYNDYFRGKRFEHLWTQFKADAGKKTFLFIGYSLEDPNILNIIKRVRQLSGRSAKEWFLVAPNLNDSKITQLKKLNVTYINAKAEEILPQILSSLKDSVDGDYKHKRLSTETYSRFCELNGQFRPQTIVGKDKNMVTQYNPLDGTAFRHNLEMRLPEKLDLNNPSVYTSVIPFSDTLIKIPAIRIPSSRMTSFVHTLNGISMAHREDIADVLIGPSTDTLEWTVRNRSIRFKEKVKGCRYKLADCIHIKLQTPLYIIHIFENKSNEWRIEFDFNDKAYSIQEALKWLQFLIVSSEEKTLEFENVIISTQDCMDDLLEELRKIKAYFEVLDELEKEYDIEFVEIENYSDLNLTKALMILSYYKKASIRHTIDEDGHFVFNVDEKKLNGNIQIMKQANMMMTRSDKLEKIVLCGREFSFKYIITIYNDIAITQCKKVEGIESTHLVEITASTDTEDILVVDTLPDFYKNGINTGEDEGIALYYKPGERERFGFD